MNLIGMYKKLSESPTMIISAFPGTGKSHFFRTSNLKVLDSDSSKFDKKEFPANYIKHIKENSGKADVIMVSSHKIVRDALVENDIDFVLVYPQKDLKEEYIERYKERGSPDGFIKLLNENWDQWIDEMDQQTGCFKYVLSEGEFLSDIIQ